MGQAEIERAAHVGERLRAIRLERRLTLAEVATASGLTKGFISQLERGLSSISLSALARVCAALDVRFGEVLDDRPPERDSAGDAGAGWPFFDSHQDVLLSPREEPRLALLESHIPPGTSAGEMLYTFPAEMEVVYVASGMLELRIGEDVHELGAGDTLTYSPQDPHTWRNPSDSEAAVVLWFSVPNPFTPAG
ncbi:MAG: helix-turn-helix domain-containing protein [Gaiellaceae bacterium]